jgi:hypothetical protein
MLHTKTAYIVATKNATSMIENLPNHKLSLIEINTKTVLHLTC